MLVPAIEQINPWSKMFRFIVAVLVLAAVSAFAPAGRFGARTTSIAMTNDFQKAVAAGMIGASLLIGGAAKAEVDYDGIKYLGGGDKIDLNNANVRAYLKCQGMYPGAAGKVVSNAPYKAVSDIYAIPGATSAEKDAMKKCESRFVVLDSKPEYAIDLFNNGLYR